MEKCQTKDRVSRGTRAGLAALAIGALALLAAGCGAPPGPKGWAGAQPVDANDVVLVPYRKTIYAFEKAPVTQDTLPPYKWTGADTGGQFPPRSRDTYPLSVAGRDRLKGIVAGFDLESDARDRLYDSIDTLTVSGDAIKRAKTEAKIVLTNEDQLNALTDAIDDLTDAEEKALKGVRALYGDIGLSPDGDLAYVSSFGGYVFAIEVETGRTRWVLDTGDEMVGGVAVDGAKVYFGTKGSKLFALEGSNGDVNWTLDLDGEVWATPAIDGGTIYVTTLDGSLYAVDETGKLAWQRPFSGANSGIAGTPAVADGVVYVGAFDKNVYAVDADSGEPLAGFDTLTADNWFWATPLVDDGVLYAASLDGNVYAVDAKTGERAWTFDAGAPVRSSPLMTEAGLVVASRAGEVYLLDIETGEPEAAPIVIGATRVLANLAKDDDDVVYLVPQRREYHVLDAGNLLAGRGYQIPNN